MSAAEQKKSYAVIKSFRGLNTQANRTAIGEDEFSWLENAMPIGPGNIRIVPTTLAGVNGNAISFSANVQSFGSTDLLGNNYALAFLADGSAQAVNIATGVRSNIAPANTFSTANVSFTQYKDERIVIGDPAKGLFTWNGNNVVAIGSVGLIAVTNGGSGYTSPPSVTISAPNDSNGVQATAACTVSTNSGTVIGFSIDNDGTGYVSVPLVQIALPDTPGGIRATAGATIAGGKIVAITVTNPGSGYTKTPTVTITDGGGTSGNAIATIQTGAVTSVFLTNPGSGYNAAPTITFTGGGGTGAAAIAQYLTFKTGTVSTLVTNAGSGYNTAPTVTFTGGGGANANGIAILAGNVVSSIVMDNLGTGYTSNPTVTIAAPPVATGNTTATATAFAQTANISSVASYSGRIWVSAGRTVYYSASGSYNDFTSVSAGSLTIADETLHGNIRKLLSANNFLHVFGDDSINVFSDVRVASTGITLFTNTNVSASVGTKNIYAIFPYFRSVLFMNNYGIYALVGATTTKISDPLDGIFPLIDFTKPVSGGLALLYNILCAVFSFTYNDPVKGARQLQAVFFDKKWFLTSQGSPDYVTSIPAGGAVTLYGSSGNALFKLYGNSASNIASRISTALRPMGDNIRTKQALKFGIEATLGADSQIEVTVDNERTASRVYNLNSNQTAQWINTSNQIVSWQNSSNAIVSWYASQTGYYLYKSDAQQYGKYLGLTMTSNAAAMTVHTFEFEHELRARF